MDDFIDVGVFGSRAEGEEERKSLLYLEKHRRLAGGTQQTGCGREYGREAGIDPSEQAHRKIGTRINVVKVGESN